MKKRIQIRVRAIPARFVIEPPEKKVESKSFIETLREWITLIAAATGIFSVLLYLTGRSYVGGYFEAMGIPSYQLSFSLWEYGEVGWLPLFLCPIAILLFSSILAVVLDKVFEWISEWAKQKGKSISSERRQRTKRLLAGLDYSFLAMDYLFALILTLYIAYLFGLMLGKTSMLEQSHQIELVSSQPLPLDEPNTNLIGGVYTYQDLHLLTSNNGKYYLFREINQETCRPVKVYIVSASPNIQLNLLSPVSLTNKCPKKTNPVATATPSAIPTP